EPLVQEKVPPRLFEMATSDLFYYGGNQYLVYADRTSGFSLIAKYNGDPSASEVIKDLRHFFSLMGVPNILRSDNGPQYASEEMKEFLKKWGTTHRPSSLHNPQSNGHAEATVKTVKQLLAKVDGDIKDEDLSADILELRNTPRVDGCSPAQTLFGRPLRSQVPCHWRSFTPKWQPKSEDAYMKRLENAAKAKMYYDRSTRIRKHLSVGDKVLVQDTSRKRWNKVATIVESGFRRYRIKLPSGRTLWRNMKFLRKLHTTFDNEDDDRPANTNSKSNANDHPRRSNRNRRKSKHFNDHE
ncbi:Uncharacterized protein FKW44_004319, partial [Caligus rogercresseyi]